MSSFSFSKNTRVSEVWIALRRLDMNDDRVVALREVSIPPSAEGPMIIQIITSTFGLNSSDVILKAKGLRCLLVEMQTCFEVLSRKILFHDQIRNHHGCLIPLNNLIPANSKHMPYVLEVVKVFQHVRPKPRTIPTTVLNRSMKTRLQTIDRRIQRLGELLPQIKLRHNEKLNQEIDCLNQKLRFLHKRMQVADSRSWKGVLIRAPLW